MVNSIDFSNFSGFFKTGIPDIVLYPSLLFCMVCIFIGICSARIKDKRLFILSTLFIEYLFIVVCSTVVCRSSLEIRRIELMPFWDYFAIANKTPGVSVWDIILNIVLFLPFGFLLSAIKPEWRWSKVMLLGFGFSFCIEFSQFIFIKGIAQTDDLMHNTLGALLGFGVHQLINSVLQCCRKSTSLN